MILNFEKYNERVNITRQGKKVLADDAPLKSLDVETVSGNCAVYLEKTGNFMFPKGKFWIYFFDSHENTKKLQTGEIEMLLFPHRRRFDFNAAPISDVWKKGHGGKGTQHILGLIEGQVYDIDKLVMIEMMSVRPGFKSNRINSFMVDVVKNLQKENFPDYQIAFEDPTVDGLEFVAKYDPSLMIYWTMTHRPKNWQNMQNVLKNVTALK